MNKVDRFVYRSFQIDTNRINSREHLPYMNQLEQWHKRGVIHIDLSEIAQEEVIQSRDQQRAEKALGHIYSKTLASTQDEQELLHKIENILFPQGAKNQNQKNDIEIIFNANKYGSILVTADGASKSQPGGILGHKAELKILGIDVMSDQEAVDYIRNLIQKRDQRAIKMNKSFGLHLPDWVGKD